MDQPPVATFVADPSGRLLEASACAVEMLGRPRAEVLGADLGELLAPDDRAAARDRVAKVELGGTLVEECRLLHADGTTIPVELLVARLADGRIQIVARDAAARKAHGEVLRRADARFRALIEHLPDMVAVHRDGKFVFVNSAAVRMLGVETKEQLVGRPVASIIHPDDRAAVLERIRSMAETDERMPWLEERLLRADGQVVLVEVMAIPVLFDGEPAFLAVARDVGERNRIQAQLAQTDRLASVGTVVAGVAHEINNPLMYVLLNLDRIVEALPRVAVALGRLRAIVEARLGSAEAAPVLEEAGRYAEAAEAFDLAARARDAADGARRVQKIVLDLKTFTRVDEDVRAPVDVNVVLERALGIAASELSSRARVVRDYGEVPLVVANEGRIAQVFLNLLVNAAQAIDQGRVGDNEVRVTTAAHEGEVVVEVRDTGAGIPREHLARLFDPFFTTKPVGVGSGLGLFVCHNIVASCGGRIEVESDPGRGSRFRVRLPAAPPDTRVPSFVPPRRSMTPPQPPGPVRNVLVVEHEPRIRGAVAGLLDQVYRTTVAASAAEARAVLETSTAPGGERFDAVLLDVDVPDARAVSLLQWLESREPELARRTVLVSEGDLDEQAHGFLERVGARTLEKPYDLGALTAALDAVLV